MGGFKNNHILVYKATRLDWKTGYNIIYTHIMFMIILISRASVISLSEPDGKEVHLCGVSSEYVISHIFA
jgi:hypothetical protein